MDNPKKHVTFLWLCFTGITSTIFPMTTGSSEMGKRAEFDSVLQELRTQHSAGTRACSNLHILEEEVDWVDILREHPQTQAASAATHQPEVSPQALRKLSRSNRGVSTTCDVLPGFSSASSSPSSLSVHARQDGRPTRLATAPSKQALKTQALFDAIRTLESTQTETIKKLIKKYGTTALDPETGNTLLHVLIQQLCDLETKSKLVGGILRFYIAEGRLDKINVGARNNRGETAMDILARAQQTISSLCEHEDRLPRLQAALEATHACDTALNGR